MIILASALTLLGCSGGTSSPRLVEDFNFGWRFQLGDDPEWAAEGYDDSSWRSLHLPHDWSIEGEFSADNPSTPGGGALPGGIGWYRKTFTLPADGARRSIEFDGVFMNSTVYINGHELGTRPYGYSSFTYDLTPYLREGENTIAVRCDNADQPNSRWYAGCGIYRNVRLVTTSDVHVAYNGTYITTPEVGEKSGVRVETSVVSGTATEVRIESAVLDARGRKLTSADETVSLSEGENSVCQSLAISGTKLWSIDNPYLYTLRTRIWAGSELKDEYSTRFGVRSIAWDKDKGFFLNGENVKMLGVCMHHDMGCIGTAVHRRALQRQLEKLKSMGVNAIRTSHNPPAPELLELCDEMGFVVMDEAMDMWRKRKTRYDYSRFFDEWHVRDVQDFVRRDRNHPSVVLWSIGNEILEQSDSRGDLIENLSAEEANTLLNFIQSLGQSDGSETNPNVLLTRHLAQLVRDLDTTRAITAGCNGVWPGNNLLRSGAIDVFGFNYHPQLYDSCRVWFPNNPIIGSETASALNSRGVYYQPSTRAQKLPGKDWIEGQQDTHQCTDYDVCSAPWANTHTDAWVAVRDRDFVAGTFLWTGFDYLGEPTPYGWPSRSSYFGVFDLAGFPKDSYWLYKAEWTPETTLHLFPHWNWTEGQNIDIWAYYNNADEVELLVNGKSLGRRSKTSDVLHAEWLAVPYEPGRIEAVSYKDGKEVARDARYTAGEPVTLRLTADRSSISADGYDLAFVTVDAIDANGREVPVADDMLSFKVDGSGELYGVDNGNAADTLSLKGCRKALFSGKALAVVRSLRGEKGTATLSVSAPYATVKININTK
jgi:beta-galactosidase